jgi:hypothetical protein
MDRSRDEAYGAILSAQQTERSPREGLASIAVPFLVHTIGPHPSVQRQVSKHLVRQC